MSLIGKKCRPCEGGVNILTGDQIENFHKELNSGWEVVNNEILKRTFYFVNYRQTMEFVNRIADLSEKEGHHPVMHVYYGKVEIGLWSHAINGLSENDFILAGKIERL